MRVCSKKDCVHGGVAQPLTNFQRDASKKSGYKSACKDCCNAQTRERRKRQKLEIQEALRRSLFDKPGFLRYINKSRPKLLAPSFGYYYAVRTMRVSKFVDKLIFPDPLDKAG